MARASIPLLDLGGDGELWNQIDNVHGASMERKLGTVTGPIRVDVDLSVFVDVNTPKQYPSASFLSDSANFLTDFYDLLRSQFQSVADSLEGDTDFAVNVVAVTVTPLKGAKVKKPKRKKQKKTKSKKSTRTRRAAAKRRAKSRKRDARGRFI